MKNNYFKLSLFSFVFMGISSSLLAQKAIHPVSQFDVDQLGIGSKSRTKSLNKSTTCQDTLRYSEMKETIFGSGTYYFTDLYQQSNEAISMTFLASNNTNMTGIEIFARNSINSNLANVVVQCGVYSVNATGDPLNLIGSGTINLSTNTFEKHIINFPIPITVIGNYAIVIQPISINGIVDLLTNDVAINPAYDETLSRFKSNFYASSNGNWITMPSFSEFVITPANFEPLVAPIISYTLNTVASASPLTSCIGTMINFSQTTTPAGIEGNRFYNWWSFIEHFNTSAVDSTYNWYLGSGSPELQSLGTSASHVYSAAGQYPIKVINHGGFWSYCNDSSIVQIIINEPTIATLIETALDSYTLNGQTYTQSGTYSQIIPNAAGCDSTITLNLTLNFTGTDEKKDFAISIYPNPSHDELFIKTDIELFSTYQFVDISGKTLLNGKIESTLVKVDVRELTSGIYFVHIAGKNSAFKLIIE